MRAADRKAHFLENPRHAVADGRRRSQGQIDDAKLGIKPPGRLCRNHLTHSRDLECGSLDRLGDHIEFFSLAELQRMVDNARAGYADAYHTLGLADPVERTRHKGVILNGVAEHDELRAAKAILLAREMRRFLDDFTHPRHGVHIDTGLRRADVDARTHDIRLRQRLRNCAQQLFIARCKALLHERGEAADEVHAAGLRRLVHRQRKGHIVLRLAASGDERHRCHGDALVDDRDTELALDGLAGFDEVFGLMTNFIVNFLAAATRILARAVQKRNAHRDRADVQMLLVDHVDRVNDFL